jgi:hypothetical protein
MLGMTKYKHLVSDEHFIETVKNSFSIAEALRKMGMSHFGAAYLYFKKRVKELSVDTSHFLGQGHGKGKSFVSLKKIPLDKILIKDSDRVLRSEYKRRLIKEGLLKEECAICRLGAVWCDKPIVLQIDHINGDCLDHRIENLRLLCPNCHSQTETFCSRAIGKTSKTERIHGIARPQKEKAKYFCYICGIEVKRKGSKTCGPCYAIHRKELQTPYDRETKIVWPPIEELLERLTKISYLQLGKELGVSDNAIRKHIKNNS